MQDARTRPVWRGSARPVGATDTLSQVPTHAPNARPFPGGCRCKRSSPQAGHGSAPGAQPQNRGGCRSTTFTQRAAMPLAGVMLRFCPSDTCVEALPPAPPSGPAFGGKVFEQGIELNEAIQVGPDPIDPVSLWEEEIRI